MCYYLRRNGRDNIRISFFLILFSFTAKKMKLITIYIYINIFKIKINVNKLSRNEKKLNGFNNYKIIVKKLIQFINN